MTDVVITLSGFSVDVASDNSYVLNVYYKASDGHSVDNDTFTFSTGAKLTRFLKKELLAPKTPPVEDAA